MPRWRAISFKLSQNLSSRLTLVLWPAMTIERFETEDFMASPPHRRNRKRSLLNRCANSLNLWYKNTVNGERLGVNSGVPAGIGGKPLRQQRAPGVVPRYPNALQGLSQNPSPSRSP